MPRRPYIRAPDSQSIRDAEDTTRSVSLPEPDSTIIVVMGQTGSGKSTFIKTATGNQEIIVGHELKSCTKGVMWYQVPDTNVFLIDTPGFDDTYNDDLSILRTIAQMLEDFFDNNIRTRGVIYMHDISEARMKRSALKNMRMFEKIVGEGHMSSCCLVTSKWGLQDAAKSFQNETELFTTRDFWGLLCDRGARVARFMGTSQSAAAIWSSLSMNTSFTNQITKEYSIDDQPLANTSAGKLVDQNLEQVTKEHAEEIAQLRQDIQRAYERQDRGLALELDNDLQKAQLELEELRKDRMIILAERKMENEQFHAKFNAMREEHAKSLTSLLAAEREEARARKARRRNRMGRWIARVTGFMFASSLPASAPGIMAVAATLAGVEVLCQIHKNSEDDDYGEKGR